jgi:nitroimidazol reductase NimA-like FMN-containing flavoprotein (pyridoxamine 5'-phosphate oxidase superfamily)
MGPTFRDMSPAQCRERIARGGVGRVVWCAHGRPQIQPVNFAVIDDAIVFRTAPYTGLGMQVAGRQVAFEVDEIDHDTQSGWSVVIHAEASAVQDPDEILRLRRSGPQPWAEGQRNLVVRLRPQRMTGRVVGDAESSGRSAG